MPYLQTLIKGGDASRNPTLELIMPKIIKYTKKMLQYWLLNLVVDKLQLALPASGPSFQL